MGAFVTLFNYIGYRLMLSPWHLSQAVVGLLSVAYLTGTWSSPKAGAMTARYGRGPVMLVHGVMLLGLLLTLFSSLWLILPGCCSSPPVSSPPTRSPAAGLAHARVAPKVRRHRCICSAIIWAPVSPGR
jgi:YNFM family putative membrane transporter